MTKIEMAEKTLVIVSARSCYADLKVAGNNWLDSIGKGYEKEKYAEYIEALKDCVSSIDDCIAFTETDFCKQIYGVEGAKALKSASNKAKKEGVKYCLCDACTCGGEILDSIKK